MLYSPCYHSNIIPQTKERKIKMKMKKLLSGFMAAACLFAFAGCQSTTPATTEAGGDNNAAATDESLNKVLESKKFILGLDATFVPMGYTDDNDQIVGFDIDVAEEVCSRLGVELVKQPINWDTKETDLDLGKIDCIWNGLSVSPARAEAMNLSEAYMQNDMIFTVMNGSEYNSSADLEGKVVAVQNGSTAQEILEGSDIGNKVKISAIATNLEALQQLELGLADGVFLDSVVANYLITTTGKDYRILPDAVGEQEEYAIGFRKNDCALRDKVQSILSEMKADGKLAEISTKWFGSDITTVK